MFLSRRTWCTSPRSFEGLTKLDGRDPQFRRNIACYSVTEATLTSLYPSDGGGTESYRPPEQGLRKAADNAPIPRVAVIRLNIHYVFDTAVQVFKNPRQNVDLWSSFLVFPSTDRNFGDTGETTEIRPRQVCSLSGFFEARGVKPAHHAPGHGAESLVLTMVGIAGHDARRPLQLAHRMVESVEYIGYLRASVKRQHLKQRKL